MIERPREGGIDRGGEAGIGESEKRLKSVIYRLMSPGMRRNALRQRGVWRYSVSPTASVERVRVERDLLIETRSLPCALSWRVLCSSALLVARPVHD